MRPPLFETIKAHAAWLLVPLAVMWGMEIWDFVMPIIDLDRFGIRPRSLAGLLGIPLAPFLHGGFGHLVANSLPYVVLGGIVMLGGVDVFRKLSLWVVLAGGFGVWLLGRSDSVHIGASLLIFGYLGFLLARGLLERSVVWIAVSVAVLLLYGGMIHGVLPGRPGVSWLGHLCGFLAGAVAAGLMFGGKRGLPGGS